MKGVGDMRRKTMIVSIALLSAVLTAAACGDGDEVEDGGEAARAVTLGLPAEDVAFYGYYIAEDLGFYEEEGLDVTLQSVGGSSEVAQLLASGNMDVGEGAAGAMLPAIEQGASLHPFFTYQFGQIFDVVAPANVGFDSIDDLEGQPIGISELAGGEVPLLQALLVEVGIDPDEDVELVEVGFEPPQVVLAFEREKIVAYASHKLDIAGLNAAGVDTVSLVPEDVAQLPGEGILAAEEVADDRELLEGIGRATAKGQLVALANEDGAACVVAKFLPEAFAEGGVGREFLALLIDFAGPPQNSEGRYEFGAVDVEGWDAYVDLFLNSGTISEEIDMSEYVIDDLFDAVNDFDYEAVVQQADDLPADC
jgi:NitT/TauT family transport system substrate-binding protein